MNGVAEWSATETANDYPPPPLQVFQLRKRPTVTREPTPVQVDTQVYTQIGYVRNLNEAS